MIERLNSFNVKCCEENHNLLLKKNVHNYSEESLIEELYSLKVIKLIS